MSAGNVSGKSKPQKEIGQRLVLLQKFLRSPLFRENSLWLARSYQAFSLGSGADAEADPSLRSGRRDFDKNHGSGENIRGVIDRGDNKEFDLKYKF